MNRFVAPLGFSGHRVTRPVIAYGTNPGDQVVLVHPEQSEQSAAERVDTAVTDIEATLSGAVRNVQIDRKAIDTSHFNATVDRCSEILTTGNKPIVCLGGGATDIHVPMIVATLAHTPHIEDVMMFRDTENAAERVDLPHLTTTIPGRTEATFQSLAAQHDSDSPMTITALAETINAARSTASRHVTALEEKNIVRTNRREKEKIVEFTLLGRLLARNKSADE